MENLVIISTLFISGSVIGWGIEVFFRRFVSQKRWMNPGFLTGPYLPIYGWGVVVLFSISNIKLGLDAPWETVAKIVIIAAAMTLIEFIAGLIFIKGMGVKLWDYSDRKGNIMGIICPTFSLMWFAVGSLYYFLLNPVFVQGIRWLGNNIIYTYFIGIALGMIIVDFAYSVHLLTRLKKIKEANNTRFEDLKKEFRQRIKKLI